MYFFNCWFNLWSAVWYLNMSTVLQQCLLPHSPPLTWNVKHKKTFVPLHFLDVIYIQCIYIGLLRIFNSISSFVSDCMVELESVRLSAVRLFHLSTARPAFFSSLKETSKETSLSQTSKAPYSAMCNGPEQIHESFSHNQANLNLKKFNHSYTSLLFFQPTTEDSVYSFTSNYLHVCEVVLIVTLTFPMFPNYWISVILFWN